jgi:hypothetical protein
MTADDQANRCFGIGLDRLLELTTSESRVLFNDTAQLDTKSVIGLPRVSDSNEHDIYLAICKEANIDVQSRS